MTFDAPATVEVPALMPPGDEISLGELSRNLATVAEQLRDVVQELRELPKSYIPRGEYELQMGSVKVDVGRIDRQLERHEQDIKAAVAAAAANLALTEKDLATQIDRVDERRVSATRWGIGLAATALGLTFTGFGVGFAVLSRLLGGT